MEKILADTKSYPLVYALAGLYTGKDLAEATDMVREALAKVLEPGEPMTAEHAGAQSVKWRMRGWLRIYYLFNNQSTFFLGRPEPDVQAKLEEMLFLYGCHKSTVKRADLRFIWFIQGSGFGVKRQVGLQDTENKPTHTGLKSSSDQHGWVV